MKYHLTKKSRAAHAVAAAVSLFAVSAANASITNWGIHSSFESAQETVAPGLFNDIYEFTLPGSPSSVTSVAVSNNLTSFTDIPAGHVALFQGVFGDAGPDLMVQQYVFTGTTGSTPHTVLGVAGDAYYYDVSGIAIGSVGGQYQFASTISPVPEPGVYAMMLAGFGLMGVLIRRRARTAD